jgi:hypothetical protein
MMANKEPVRGTYQHYKGDFYEVLGVADNPAQEGRWVVYQALGITEDLTGEHEHRVLRSGNKGALSICSVERFAAKCAHLQACGYPSPFDVAMFRRRELQLEAELKWHDDLDRVLTGLEEQIP